jgi:hypothetical protein
MFQEQNISLKESHYESVQNNQEHSNDSIEHTFKKLFPEMFPAI